MEQNYVYEEEEEQGLTFKKIGMFFKRGWLYMLISVVVAALLATAIALPIKVFYKSEQVGSTSIEYLFEGADLGKDPNGGTLDTDNIISPSVLGKAVAAAGLGDEITDISELRAACRVDGVYPDSYYELVQAAADGDQAAITALRNYTMIPTRYDIVISEPKELGLSDAQVKTLLDKIVAAYFEDFEARFSVSNMFATNIYNLSESVGLEYTDIYDEYSASLVPVTEYIAELQAAAPTFTSTKNNTDFATLLSDVKRLSANYDAYNTYLLANNVWKDKATASVTLTKSQTTITERRKNLEARKDNLKAQINAIPPLTITVVNGEGSNSDITGTATAYYTMLDKYNAELNECDKQLEIYDNQLSNIQLRLADIEVEKPTPDDKLATAEAMLETLESSTVALMEKVNNTIADYYDTTFVASSVRRVKPSVVTRKSAEFNLLVVYACALAGGLLIGAIIAGVAISKQKAKAAKKAEAAAKPDTDAAKAE